MPLAAAKFAWSLRTCISAAASVLLGAWTHVIWDSFTHPGGWVVLRVAVLREPLFHVGDTELSVCYLLQQLSTFAGGAALIAAYWGWLRNAARLSPPDSGSDQPRYGLLAALAVSALAIAIPIAMRMAGHFQGYLAVRVFVFRTGVYAAGIFVPLLVASAVAFYVIKRKSA
jgi:hypothetical protein